MAKSVVPTTAGNKTQHSKEQPFTTAWTTVAHVNISLDISMLKCNAVSVWGIGEGSLLRILRWWFSLSFYNFVLSDHWMENRVGIRAVTNEGEKKNISAAARKCTQVFVLTFCSRKVNRINYILQEISQIDATVRRHEAAACWQPPTMYFRREFKSFLNRL
jgi:hypothetical protein